MNKDEQLRFLLDHGLVAIVRLKEPTELVPIAQAIEAGGVRVIEFTMGTPNALDAISRLARDWGDRILLGAGTVLDPETGRAALLATWAGARRGRDPCGRVRETDRARVAASGLGQQVGRRAHRAQRAAEPDVASRRRGKCLVGL